MEFFLHLFTPRPSNNHRAKVLHTSILSFLIVSLVAFQIILATIGHLNPQILAFASNINVSDLLRDTNAKRAFAGVGALSLSTELSNAAAGKARDMFENHYWAHISPDGKDPWIFITTAGYNYLFAGENLARDFGDSKAVVEAWMNSASHKENLLNAKFKDVGFAVVNGKYGDNETTLVVQMFGARSSSAPTVAAPSVAKPVATNSGRVSEESQYASPSGSPENLIPQAPAPSSGVILKTQITDGKQSSIFDTFSVTKNVSTALLIGLIAVLVVDSLIAYRRKIVRLSGHNFAHMIFLLAVLVALNVIGRGVIL